MTSAAPLFQGFKIKTTPPKKKTTNKKTINGTCSERKEIERLLALIAFIRLGYDNKGMLGKDEFKKIALFQSKVGRKGSWLIP